MDIPTPPASIEVAEWRRAVAVLAATHVLKEQVSPLGAVDHVLMVAERLDRYISTGQTSRF